MKTLAIMSDLHIDLNAFGEWETTTFIQTLQEKKVTHLHIAGDISNHHKSISDPFLETLRQHFTVTYNLGNHDMLDLTEEEIEAQDFQLHQIGNRQLLAFHGWYDYSFVGEDEKTILKRKQLWFDRRIDRPLSDREICQNILQRLEEELQKLDTNHLILAVHFVPHQHFTMWHEKFAPFNAFFGSQAFHQLFVKYGVRDVIFGHAHRSFGTVELDRVRYHSRPLGYIREWDLTINFVQDHPELNPTGTWNLSKRYNLIKTNPRYQAHKKEKFKDELLHSMALFEVG